MRAENLKYNASVCGWYYPRSRFLGNSAASCAEGHLILDFKNENEKYEITLPDYYARGIIFGKVTMEICGKTYIKCFNSRLRADIEFKSKPFFGGEYGLVEATIKDGDTLLYEIKGKWTNGFSIKKAGEKEWKSFFDCETAPRIEKNIIPRNHLLSNEAHVVWRFLTRAIYEGNVEHAATEKENVEKKQREIQKSREQNKIEFKPTFFKKIEDGKFWEFIGHDLPEYQLLHHKIGSSEYENIRTSIKETPFLKLHPEEENTLPNDNKLQDNKQQTVDESMD